MIKKLLIANRGEIAVRIAATCRKMGITSVAVYSDADRDSLHVRSCDEAYHIGPSPAAESYLLTERILAAAKASGSEAIHPGYGFLSENAVFASRVVEAGLIWVGPPPGAIELMGSKIESKKLAEGAGVPVVPGYLGEDQSAEKLAAEAEWIGFPVLIKASAGGGGKGMRVVRAAEDMRDSVEAARREAQAAFGDPVVLLEKYLDEPRHIEVQVLGDNDGNVVALGERECSIQRRHQKVVEESPSPALTSDLRKSITGAAVALARAAGYANAGTVEFIYQGGKFFFLEMNTRLQVEHPVTELALGIDLVEAQLRVASGEPLWFTQNDIEFRAHAMEVRLYAEDPAHDFVPSTGRLSVLRYPASARVDAGFVQGDEITPYYDPMIAKIITSGPDRNAALLAMQDALGEMEVQGVKTNLGFLRWLFSHPVFAAGELSTGFIDRYYTPGEQAHVPIEAAIGASLWLGGGPTTAFAGARLPWRQGRQEIPSRLAVEGQTFVCSWSARPGDTGHWTVRVEQDSKEVFEGAVEISVGQGAPGKQGARLLLRVEGQDATRSIIVVPGGPGTVAASLDGRTFQVRRAPTVSTDALGAVHRPAGEDSLESPMPGKVLQVLVREGDSVEQEQRLVIVEAMKMEFTVRAPHAGRVAAVHYSEGAQVAAGDVLVELEK